MSEIETLRSAEAAMQAGSEEAGRLVRGLLDTYRCNFVISDSVPYGHWCRLPWSWQNGIEEAVAVRRGLPSRDMCGPVGVSLMTLREIARHAR